MPIRPRRAGLGGLSSGGGGGFWPAWLVWSRAAPRPVTGRRGRVRARSGVRARGGGAHLLSFFAARVLKRWVVREVHCRNRSGFLAAFDVAPATPAAAAVLARRRRAGARVPLATAGGMGGFGVLLVADALRMEETRAISRTMRGVRARGPCGRRPHCPCRGRPAGAHAGRAGVRIRRGGAGR